MIVDEVVDEIGKIRGMTRLDEDLFDDPPRQSAEQKAKEFERWSFATGLSKVDLVNEIAKVIAVEFHAGRMTFAFGDAIANYLFSVINDARMADDSLAWKVYLAFDLGEYTPNEISTVPMIAEIVQRIRVKKRFGEIQTWKSGFEAKRCQRRRCKSAPGYFR